MPKGKIEWGRLISKMSPYTIQKGLRYLKHYGVKEFWVRLHERFEPEEVPYGPWYEAYIPTREELEKQKKKKWKYNPKISIIVPAYKTPEMFLRQMIDSLLVQTYENWELCIANASPEDASMEYVLKEYAKKDSRILWKKLEENKGIAENTNAAFEMAGGEFVGLLDHDDLLAPNALYEIAEALEKQGGQSTHGQGGHQHPQIGGDGAGQTGGAHSGKGGTVEAQRPWGHLSNGHDVGHFLRRHPLVDLHFTGDEGNHGQAAEAGKANFGKTPEKLKKDHGVSSPFPSMYLLRISPHTAPMTTSHTQLTFRNRYRQKLTAVTTAQGGQRNAPFTIPTRALAMMGTTAHRTPIMAAITQGLWRTAE